MLSRRIGLVGREIYWEWLKWTVMSFFIIVGGYVISTLFFEDWMREVDVTISNGFSIVRILMLVIGILIATMYFRPYVRRGITRKEFFAGASFSGIGLAVSMLVLVWIAAFVETVVLPGESLGTEVGSSFLLLLQGLLYYFIGWMAGAAFLRFHVVIGIVMSVAGIVLLIANDLVWQEAGFSMGGAITLDSVGDLSVWLAAAVTAGMLALVIFLVRLFTRNCVIPMK